MSFLGYNSRGGKKFSFPIGGGAGEISERKWCCQIEYIYGLMVKSPSEA